jgi:hypothetical protein
MPVWQHPLSDHWRTANSLCLDCQKQSSSAFGLSLWVARDDFELTSGELNFWTTKAEDGNSKLCAFCSNCGSRIYHAFGDDDPFSVKAGSLDETSWLEPVVHIWIKRAHRWLNLEQSGTPCHQEEPDSFDPFIADWSVKKI